MEKEYIAARIFFEAVLPNLPKIFDYYPTLAEKFKKRKFILQLKVEEVDCPLVITFEVTDGVWLCNLGQYNEKADIEFSFNTANNFNTYMTGLGSPTPKIKGLLKLSLLKDVLVVLGKFASIMQANTPHLSKIDRECQACMLLNVLPVAVNVLKVENLAELALSFSSIANVKLMIAVRGLDCQVKDIVLKYAPQNTTESAEEQLYSFVFDNIDQAVDFLLNGYIAEESYGNNTHFAVELMKFFVNSVNYYARVKFRN